MTKHMVGIRTDEGDEFHIGAPPGPDYHTLCGVDADDPAIGHHGVTPVPRGQVVTCQQCKSIYQFVKLLRLGSRCV